MPPKRNDQINGYEQLVIFIMDVVRQGWKNLDEVELVEDTWRKKLIEAKALPYRPNDKYYRLRQLVEKTCFGVKYDRKISARSAFTIYTPLKCYDDEFFALKYIRSIILKQVPELLEARSKGVEYEAEFLQSELLRELQRRNFDIPHHLLKYSQHLLELIQQHKGKLILDKSDEPDDVSCVSMNALRKPVINKKEVCVSEFLNIPSKIDGLYRKQCLPKTRAEADRKLKLFIIYKMLTSREHSGIDVPDEVFPQDEEDQTVNDENVMMCQLFKILKPRQINDEFQNSVLQLGNKNYTFKTCALRLSPSSSLDPELADFTGDDQ